MAVVAAFELQDFVPAGKATGNANRRHHRFRTAINQAAFLQKRVGLKQKLDKLDLLGMARAEAGRLSSPALPARSTTAGCECPRMCGPKERQKST